MTPSVSLILPVRNQQRGLRNRVLDLAEVLTDLATWFEILIVDYGSTDPTRELAADLAREFPQIRFADKCYADDLLRATRYGIRHSTGEIVFIHDANLPFSSSLLRNLWDLRDDDELVMAQSPSVALEAESPSETSPVPSGKPGPGSSLQMLRRSALRELQQTTDRDSMSVERITRTDLTREADPTLPEPNLVSRFRRIVFG